MIPNATRVRITVERFEISANPDTYNREINKEQLLETCADPTGDNLEMIRKQVELCLSGYRAPELPMHKIGEWS